MKSNYIWEGRPQSTNVLDLRWTYAQNEYNNNNTGAQSFLSTEIDKKNVVLGILFVGLIVSGIMIIKNKNK